VGLIFYFFFSDESCFGYGFLVFYLVFHMVPSTFRVIKSQKELTFIFRL
jgi:hypothetical protein